MPWISASNRYSGNIPFIPAKKKSNGMQAREQWKSRTGFILASAGSAVGLGNVWRFPYLAGEHGGGVFLALYLVFVFTIGISILLAEFTIGRAAKRQPAGAFRVLGGGRWIAAGYFGVASAFFVLSFYSVVGGWTLAYMVKAITSGLDGTTAESAGQVFNALTADPFKPMAYHGIFMALTIVIVMRGVRSGIEATSKMLMPALFILLLVLVGRALTLPNAGAGLAFYLQPDFTRVTTGTVIAALSQAFFSLSVGLGAMITYGSYLSSQESLPKSAAWVAVIDSGVAFLAGLMIFAAVFAFGLNPAAGPGLTFVTLPTIFGKLPAGPLFAFAFFSLLALAALTSAVSLLEVAVAYLIDEHGVSRSHAALLLGVIIFLLGIPSSLSLGVWSDVTLLGLGVMDFMDSATTKVLMPFGSILLSLFAGWVVYPRLAREMMQQAGDGMAIPLRVWGIVCKFLGPAAILWIMATGLLP